MPAHLVSPHCILVAGVKGGAPGAMAHPNLLSPDGCLICKQLVFSISGLGIYRFIELGGRLRVNLPLVAPTEAVGYV